MLTRASAWAAMVLMTGCAGSEQNTGAPVEWECACQWSDESPVRTARYCGTADSAEAIAAAFCVGSGRPPVPAPLSCGCNPCMPSATPCTPDFSSDSQ